MPSLDTLCCCCCWVFLLERLNSDTLRQLWLKEVGAGTFFPGEGSEYLAQRCCTEAQQVPSSAGLPGKGEPGSPTDCSTLLSLICRARKKASPLESCEEWTAEAGELYMCFCYWHEKGCNSKEMNWYLPNCSSPSMWDSPVRGKEVFIHHLCLGDC